jgi:hypothetical protein
MRQTETSRKICTGLIADENARLEKFGSLNFKSIRHPDMRVDVFVPSREQH